MNWKKLGKAVLFPHIAVLLLLLPAGAAFLVYAMLALEETSPIRIASYVLAFYALTVWCARTPRLIRSLRALKHENRYVRVWLDDPGLRANVTLAGGCLWNGAYAAMQLGLGVRHRSAWFFSLAAYYACLSVMRAFLVRHTLRHRPGEDIRRELKRAKACGWVFLFMNLALSGMMLLMIRENRVTRHHEITTIAMAAYAFTSLTMSIVSAVRCRRYQSPALSASRAVSLAAACVSMLTLENTMLATFGGGQMPARTRMLFLALSGGAVSALIIVMALYMIVRSYREVKQAEGGSGT